MKEFWSYEKKRRVDGDEHRWHFVSHYILDDAAPYRYELFFRDDDREQYGVLRFKDRKANPYRNYEAMVFKIMNNKAFRKGLIDPTTKGIWNKNWK